MHSIIDSSFAVKIFIHILSDDCKSKFTERGQKPISTVTGLTEGVSFPVVNEIHASLALRGSAPITLISLLIPFTQ